jgi:hypothetical protein
MFSQTTAALICVLIALFPLPEESINAGFYILFWDDAVTCVYP